VTFHVMGTAIREEPALADRNAATTPITVLSLR